ncbi:MAG TPA: anthranilate phosphoribosyltransferase [Chloroflexota bacterium]|jgi:anthranilate phosphoribosyltransferase
MALPGSTSELVSLVQELRHSTPKVEASGPVLDTAGTGGDGAKTVNLSTLAAIVAAAAGVQVAKQNRPAISSYCGSTEVLHEFGVAYDLPPEAAASCLRETGICFLYQPLYHPGVIKSAKLHTNIFTSPARIERSTSDWLLPLVNPAGADHFMVGVADGEMASQIADVLSQLGTQHALVIHGDDGIDEITCTTTTTVHEVSAGKVNTWTLDPTQYGYLRAPRHAILGGDAVENALISRQALAGKRSLYGQYVEINSAAALYAANRVASLEEGMALAKETLGSGAAARKLDQVIQASQRLQAQVPSSAGRS